MSCGLCSSLVCVVMYSGQCPVVCAAVWCVLLCTVVNVLWSVQQFGVCCYVQWSMSCGLCSSLVCVVMYSGQCPVVCVAVWVCVVMYSGQCPVVCVAVWCVLLCTVVNVS